MFPSESPNYSLTSVFSGSPAGKTPYLANPITTDSTLQTSQFWSLDAKTKLLAFVGGPASSMCCTCLNISFPTDKLTGTSAASEPYGPALPSYVPDPHPPVIQSSPEPVHLASFNATAGRFYLKPAPIHNLPGGR